jgi:UDP-N-acetylmuramoylalanine--D-glutamate ligase
MDRGVDWRPLMPHMKEHVPRAVICLPDSGTDIAEVMEASGLDPAGGIQCASSLESAMRTVSGLVKAGDTVLLSPGAPSFPRFRDYEDRGRHFAKFAGF